MQLMYVFITVTYTSHSKTISVVITILCNVCKAGVKVVEIQGYGRHITSWRVEADKLIKRLTRSYILCTTISFLVQERQLYEWLVSCDIAMIASLARFTLFSEVVYT